MYKTRLCLRVPPCGDTPPPLLVRLALEPQPPQDILHQLAWHRLALDPREGKQIRTEEHASGLVLKRISPRDLCDRELCVNQI